MWSDTMEVKRTDNHQDPITMRSDTKRCLFSALTWANPTHSGPIYMLNHRIKDHLCQK